MNEFKTFIGIDVSKKTFDAALLRSTDQVTTIHQSFDQNMQGYKAFIQWLKSHDVTIGGDVLFCLEHTGIYISGIVNFLVSISAIVYNLKKLLKWEKKRIKVMAMAKMKKIENDLKNLLFLLFPIKGFQLSPYGQKKIKTGTVKIFS